MTTMLILIVLKLGEVTGIFLGDFDYYNACAAAAHDLHTALTYGFADEALSKLVEGSDAIGLLCVARPEA